MFVAYGEPKLRWLDDLLVPDDVVFLISQPDNPLKPLNMTSENQLEETGRPV